VVNGAKRLVVEHRHSRFRSCAGGRLLAVQIQALTVQRYGGRFEDR
jgi:hypothetical protein